MWKVGLLEKDLKKQQMKLEGYDTQCGKVKNLLPPKDISSNQLFCSK